MLLLTGCNQPAEPPTTIDPPLVATTPTSAESVASAAPETTPELVKPATVSAAAMKGEVGNLQGDVWLMPSNGKLTASDLWCPDGIALIEVCAYGKPAAGVAPKLKLRAINTKLSKAFDIADNYPIENVTLAAHSFKPIAPLPPGNYNIDIFYTNNSEGIAADSKEDRNLFIASVTTNPDKAVVAVQAPATAPTAKPNPLTRAGKEMKSTIGNADGGAWKMTANGKLIAHDLYTAKPIAAMTLSARATSAAGGWPKVKVVLVETKTSTQILAYDPLIVDTAQAKDYTKTFDPPLDQGNYNVEFVYLNNSDNIPASSTEDRNVWIESVTLTAE